MDLGNYGIGGNEVKIDASEGIAEIPAQLHKSVAI